MPGGATALAVVLVTSGCLLVACGTSNPYALPKYDPNAPVPTGAAASARPAGVAGSPTKKPLMASRAATPPPQVKFTPADPWGEGAWVERGRIAASTKQQKAVVTAALAYLKLRVQQSNTWQVDQVALAAVATGQAADNARQRARFEQDQGWRLIGRFIANLSSVQVSGDSASVSGCSFDGTSEVDENGGVVIAPPGGVRITMELQRTGDVWRVLAWPKKPAYCDWRAR